MEPKNIKNTKAYKLGNSGENKVVLKLRTFMREEQILHNIMLIDDKNNTHQIDVIAITTAGIFVIEVKNVCGYQIVCDNDSTYWTYDWKKGGEIIKCRLYNPIIQNKTHVEQIRRITNNEYPVYSIVTFSNNNKLIHKYPLDDMVVQLNNIKNYFMLFPRNKLSDDDIARIRKLILDSNHPEISIQEHIQNIKRNIYG